MTLKEKIEKQIDISPLYEIYNKVREKVWYQVNDPVYWQIKNQLENYVSREMFLIEKRIYDLKT